MKINDLTGQSEDTNPKQGKAVSDLLRIIHNDYEQARKQIEDISSFFSSREMAIEHNFQDVPGITNSPALQNKTDKGISYIRVNCLGNFNVVIGYHQVEQWRSLKAKTVFKYLITQRGHFTTRDMLMEAIWQDCAPNVANSNLKTAVHSLRKTLGEASTGRGNFNYIDFTGGNYSINHEITLQVDAEDFEKYWFRGLRLESERNFTGAIDAYLAAEKLYKGDYLEEDRYEDWTLMRREFLKDTYLNILIKLAIYYAQAADYENCIKICQKILDKDPCCEEGYRHLMRCYSRIGQRNRAIQWYKKCEKIITTELKVKPEPLTLSLFDRLMVDEVI